MEKRAPPLRPGHVCFRSGGARFTICVIVVLVARGLDRLRSNSRVSATNLSLARVKRVTLTTNTCYTNTNGSGVTRRSRCAWGAAAFHAEYIPPPLVWGVKCILAVIGTGGPAGADLVLRLVREHGPVDDVANGVDVGDVGLERAVHLHLSLGAHFHTHLRVPFLSSQGAYIILHIVLHCTGPPVRANNGKDALNTPDKAIIPITRINEFSRRAGWIQSSDLFPVKHVCCDLYPVVTLTQTRARTVLPPVSELPRRERVREA
eukprot:5886370-Pyramimonas_sp.AAC.1